MAPDDEKAAILRLVPGVDPTSLPLGPSEGFILSRIDGVASIDEIGDMTGLGAARVREVAQTLVEGGVAEWIEVASPKPRHSQRPARAPTPSRGVVRTKPAPPNASRTLYDPQEVEEPDVDLDLERRHLILDAFYRLDDLTFYELLGLEEDADKKEIRNAYFLLSKRFHPDTLFGKRLGTYKAKMEAVFQRLTEAYEVLGKKRTRQEYDAYIRLRARTRAAQTGIDEGKRAAERLEREVARAASSAVVQPGPEGGPQGSGKVATPPPAAGARDDLIRPDAPFPFAIAPPPAVAPDREMSEEAKARSRELIARRLAAATGRTMPPRAGTTPRPSPPPGEPASREDLLRGLASSLRQVATVTGGRGRAEAHLAAAKEAEGDGNLVSAANSLRLALALEPDRADIESEHDRVRALLASSLSTTYEQQAMYEERMGHWREASLSWLKVCEGRPDDARAHVHAAVCLLESGGDLSRAKHLAQKAVDLRPRDALGRRALGRVFFAAGMKLNAKRELEAAAKLDPTDDMVKNLLRELNA